MAENDLLKKMLARVEERKDDPNFDASEIPDDLLSNVTGGTTEEYVCCDNCGLRLLNEFATLWAHAVTCIKPEVNPEVVEPVLKKKRRKSIPKIPY